MARTSLGGVVFLLLGPALVSACCDDVRIGAFNIKTFGQAKVSDSTVLAYLAQVIRRLLKCDFQLFANVVLISNKFTIAF